jgi:hypothetical protein
MLNFKLNPIERFLCLCIRHIDYLNVKEIKSLYISIGDESAFKYAKINGVSSIVAHSLITIFGKDNIPSHWKFEYESVEEKITSYMDELETVAALLDKHNIKLLALKNSGITKGLYPHYGSCPMGDVDVLVSKNVFRQAHEILTIAGYKLKFRSPLEEDNIEAAEHGGGAEYSVQLADGKHLWFELQWRPVAGRWIQPGQEPKADDLIDCSKAISGSKVRLLAPEDNLLQVALHTAKHSYVRAPGFRLHTDVDRIVTEENIDWDIFVSKVLKLKLKTSVYISLCMAKVLLDSPIPPQVLTKIKPGTLKLSIMNKWLERVGIFEPDSPKWSKFGYIVFVCMLYDDLFDFFKGTFPSSKQLKDDYHFSNSLLLPYYHIKRLYSLLFKRVNT